MDNSLLDAAKESSKFWKFGDGSDNAEGELTGIYEGIAEEEFSGRVKKVISFRIGKDSKFLGAGPRLLKAMVNAGVDEGDEVSVKRWGKGFDTAYAVKVVKKKS